MVKLLALALVTTGVAGAQTETGDPGRATTAEITTTDLEYRLKIIADDSMMGRESGSKGNYTTAEYVASEFRRLGLQPAGEGGTYFQTVPFSKAAVDPGSRLVVKGATLEVGRDFVPSNIGAPPRLKAGRPAHGLREPA